MVCLNARYDLKCSKKLKQKNFNISFNKIEVFIVVRYDAPVRGMVGWNDGPVRSRGTLKMPQSAAWHGEMMAQSAAWPLKQQVCTCRYASPPFTIQDIPPLSPFSGCFPSPH
jgi:hypothetical protein